MYKKSKSLIFISVLIFFLFLIFILVFAWEDKEKDLNVIKIAVCPTFYYKLNKLDKDKFLIISTNSTSESLKMLESGQVDYALGGRSLYSHEPKFDYSIIGEAFSFLSDKSVVIYDYQLQEQLIYTDLDMTILKKNFGDLNYNLVDNVYNYLENNIIITGWDNTDFNKAKIVHLLKNDNSRNIKSRLPIVFCENKCNHDIIANIKKIVN